MSSTDRVRRYLLAGTLVLTPFVALASALTAIDVPDSSGVAHLAAIAPDRSQFYVSNLLGAFALAMLATCALGLMTLARRRGGALTTIGGALMYFGGIAASAGIFLYGAVLFTITDSGLDRQAMGQLDDLASDSAPIAVAFLGGFLPLFLGLVLIGIGLLRARTVPRWEPALLLVAAVAMFLSPGDGSLLDVVLLAPLLVLVAFGLEVAREPRADVVPEPPAQRSPAEAGETQATRAAEGAPRSA